MLEAFSEREQLAMRMCVEGYNCEEIADACGVSVRTVVRTLTQLRWTLLSCDPRVQ
jgi:DNA-directed RNA polymerase specialized sigma24 family protein